MADASAVLCGTSWPKHPDLWCLDFVDDADYFVMGGDAFDHGSGDLRIAEELLDFKERYPDRVFLILGNRDMNKLKLSSELHAQAPSDPHYPHDP